MSYVPGPRQLGRLAQGLKRVKFFEWATRPLGFHFWEVDLNGYHKYYPKFIGRGFKYVVLVSKGNYEVQYRNKQQHEEFIRSLQKRVADFKFLAKHEKILARIYKELWALADRLENTDWDKVTDKELARQYERYYDLYEEFIGAVSSGILIMEAMAKELKTKLEHSAQAHSLNDNLDLAVRVLSTPEKLSMVAQEEMEFLRLALKGRPGREKLSKHVKKWAYIPVYAAFEPWNLNDYTHRLSQLNKAEASAKYKELLNHRQRTKRQKAEIYRRFRLDAKTKALATLLAKYLFWRISDETTIGLLTYSRKNFFNAICQRLYISPKQLLYLIKEEVLPGFKGKELDLSLANDRMKGYAQIINPDGVAVITGTDLEKLLKQIKLVSAATAKQKSNVFAGTPANPGQATGTVKVVLDPGLIGKVKKNDILVTTNTTPAYVMAMKISGAILTEEGGITSHAAIVSRELGVPCVIGIPNITKFLKDGDKVEVDADSGTIKKL